MRDAIRSRSRSRYSKVDQTAIGAVRTNQAGQVRLLRALLACVSYYVHQTLPLILEKNLKISRSTLL